MKTFSDYLIDENEAIASFGIKENKSSIAGELTLAEQMVLMTTEEAIKYFCNLKTEEAKSRTAGVLIIKLRDTFADLKEGDEAGNSSALSILAEINLLAQSMSKAAVIEYLDNVRECYGEKENLIEALEDAVYGSERKVRYKEHHTIWEGKVGKAVITGLFFKFKNRLKTAKTDTRRFQIMADMIALSTVFTNNAIADVIAKTA